MLLSLPWRMKEGGDVTMAQKSKGGKKAPKKEKGKK